MPASTGIRSATPVRRSLQAQAAATPPAHEYAPAQTITIPDGETKTMTFRGRSGAAFGFDALTVGGDYDGVVATALTDTVQGEVTLFQQAHLTALRKLFLRRRLHGLIEVSSDQHLELKLKNRSGSASTVCVRLSAYSSAEGIEEQRKCLREAYGYVPRPKIVSVFEELASGASGQRIKVEQRPGRLQFSRWMVGADSEANLSSLQVKLRVYEQTVREQVFATQIVDAFTNRETGAPYVLDSGTPMQVIVDSGVQSALGFSALFETYQVPPASALQPSRAAVRAAGGGPASDQSAEAQAAHRAGFRRGCSL